MSELFMKYESNAFTTRFRTHIKVFTAETLQGLEVLMDSFLEENEGITVQSIQIDIPSSQGVIVYFGENVI